MYTHDCMILEIPKPVSGSIRTVVLLAVCKLNPVHSVEDPVCFWRAVLSRPARTSNSRRQTRCFFFFGVFYLELLVLDMEGPTGYRCDGDHAGPWLQWPPGRGRPANTVTVSRPHGIFK